MISLFTAIAAVGGLLGTSFYPGDKLIFALFTCVYFPILAISLFRWRSYAHFFIGVMIFGGIWLKGFVFFLTNVKLPEPTGDFVASPAAFDQVLIVATIGGAGYICGRLVGMAIETPTLVSTTPSTYANWRILAWCLAILALLSLLILNVVLGFSVRGTVPAIKIPWPLNGALTFFNDYGIAICMAILIGWDQRLGASLILGFLTICVEGAITSVATASRGIYIFHTLPVLMTAAPRLFSTRRRAVAFLILWCAVATAVPLWTTFIRYYGSERVVVLNAAERETKAQGDRLPTRDFSDLQSQLIGASAYLVFYRWVGLEGVMATSAFDKKGISLFEDAALMRRGYGDVDYYTKEISRSGFNEEAARFTHYASPAGPIAFFYFSGSLIIVFLGMAAIALTVSAIERAWQLLVQDPVPLAVAGWYLAFIAVQLSGGLQQAFSGIAAVSAIFAVAWAARKFA